MHACDVAAAAALLTGTGTYEEPLGKRCERSRAAARAADRIPSCCCSPLDRRPPCSGPKSTAARAQAPDRPACLPTCNLIDVPFLNEVVDMWLKTGSRRALLSSSGRCLCHVPAAWHGSRTTCRGRNRPRSTQRLCACVLVSTLADMPSLWPSSSMKQSKCRHVHTSAQVMLCANGHSISSRWPLYAARVSRSGAVVSLVTQRAGAGTRRTPSSTPAEPQSKPHPLSSLAVSAHQPCSRCAGAGTRVGGGGGTHTRSNEVTVHPSHSINTHHHLGSHHLHWLQAAAQYTHVRHMRQLEVNAVWPIIINKSRPHACHTLTDIAAHRRGGSYPSHGFGGSHPPQSQAANARRTREARGGQPSPLC